MENKEDRTFHSVMNLVATHYNCTSPMDYISHHALHTHIPVHHYTNHTAVTIHSLVLIFSPHLHLIYSHTFKQHSHMHHCVLFWTKQKSCFAMQSFPSVSSVYDSPCMTWTVYWTLNLRCLPTVIISALFTDYPECLPPAPIISLNSDSDSALPTLYLKLVFELCLSDLLFVLIKLLLDLTTLPLRYT